MLKIQYCSDLHLEFRENEEFLKRHPIEPVGNILVLAGDIVPFALLEKYAFFFDELSNKFEQVYWLPGNHEYYHSDIKQRTGSFIEKIRENVFILNNHVVRIQDTRLIFSTLWTELSEANQLYIAQRLSDFYVIKNGGDRFTPADYNDLFHENFLFLQETFKSKEEDINTVVISHHVPTFLNYPEKYKGDILNEAFAVELFDVIEADKPDYWIFGHHHSNVKSFSIGNTRLLTNQLGYVKCGEHTSFSCSSTFNPNP